MRNFDIATVRPENPWEMRNTMGLFMISNMWVQIFDREVGT